jgi:RNA polymerase sigma-70 factor, ECF subfamily
VRQEAQRRRRRETPAAGGCDVDALPDRTAPELLDVLGERIDVRRALRPLDGEDRRLLWLRYGEDLTQPATAAVMGMPEGTVKVRLHRLRKQLRAALDT